MRTTKRLRAALAAVGGVTELGRERYRHRRTAAGGERVWQAAVVRVLSAGSVAQ